MLAGLLRGALGDSSEASLTKRLAGTIFIIRVFSAALGYLSQILFARWMGGSDYGDVYVWTWVLLLGSMMDFGISASAQKIIPEYRTRGEHALLRGFLSGSRWMTLVVSSIVSGLLAGLVKFLSPWIDAGAMLGHQYICAPAYAAAFVMNVALCVLLVPRFGGHGAAAATSISLVFETVLLFTIVRWRLGLHMLAFGKGD